LKLKTAIEIDIILTLILYQMVEGAVFIHRVNRSLYPGERESMHVGCSGFDYDLYDRTGKFLTTIKCANDQTIEKYLDPVSTTQNTIMHVIGATFYHVTPRAKIFSKQLRRASHELIADQYILYDQYGVEIKRVYASDNEIEKYIDQSSKLRPIKIMVRHHYNYSDVKYMGIDDIILKMIKLPFLLGPESEEIFNDEKLDREWCYENIDRIPVIISTEKENIISDMTRLDTNTKADKKSHKCHIQ
jgi:hypothetical protein